MTRILVLLAAAFLLNSCGSPAPETADLILLGGEVIALAGEVTPGEATAVAIGGGRILAVGSDDQVARHRGETTRVVELNGAVVVPGFNDSHAHLYGLGVSLGQVDLMDTGSPEEIVERVAAFAGDLPDGEWLQGRGWDQNDWETQEYPDKASLDAVTGDRPALLRRVDGHAVWANSAALRRANISAETADPVGGEIIRDLRGQPTGILIDNAVDLVTETIPDPSKQEMKRRIALAVEHCLAEGVTGVHEAGVDWKLAACYREMAGAGELKMRVYAMYGNEKETLDQAIAEGPVTVGDGMLTLRAIKLYADGALGSRGALLLEDYHDQPGHRGLPVTSIEEMTDVARRGTGAGFQICVHAIGDAANRAVLDIYEKLASELEPVDPRWRIEHAQIVSPQDIPRFARLGVIAAMQPTHCTSDMDWAGTRLGEARLPDCYCWRSLLDSGARLCFGTDFPVEKVRPLDGLYSARTRTHHDGRPPGGWQPQEKIDARTALELYTAGSAYAGFMEEDLGRIQPGFRADLTILDGNPVTGRPEKLLSMRVLHTIVDGKLVHSRP